jgi:uncharacterized cupredoxin-like copper-binding protein
MSSKLALLALTGLVVSLLGAGAAQPRPQSAASLSFRMVEWDVLPQTATKTHATRVTFVVRNAGRLEHEFVVLRTAKAAGSIAARTAAEAPETGAAGEIPGIKPGQLKRLTLTLGKGHYSLICNLTGHYGQGQFVDFYVR